MYQEVNLNGERISTQSLTGRIAIAGGTNDYNQLNNKPAINDVTLSGNKSLSDLGINIPTKTSDLANDSAFPSALYVTIANNNSRTLNYGSRCLLFSSHSSSATLKGIYMRIGTSILPIIDASGITVTATDSTITIANASGYTANLFLIRNI